MNSLKVGACMCVFCVARVSGVGCTMPKALSNSKLSFSLCAEGCDTANRFLAIYQKHVLVCMCVHLSRFESPIDVCLCCSVFK